jgi:hypothetical protein
VIPALAFLLVVNRAAAGADDRCWSDLFAEIGGLDGTGRALCAYGDQLIVGGDFNHAGEVPAAHIAALDCTTWKPLGAGLSGSVFALEDWDGLLVAGGWFSRAGSGPAASIAAWDGSEWSPIGSGFNNSVYALAVYKGDLMAGGAFYLSGDDTVMHVARWDGAVWKPLGDGIMGQVYALAADEEYLYAAGWMVAAGGTVVSNIARWDGEHWDGMAGGFDRPVRTLLVTEDGLLAGGDFYTAGGIAARGVANWNGSGWNAVGAGLDNYVWALDGNSNEIYAGGYLLYSDCERLGHVAGWDGYMWTPLGSGVRPEGTGYVYELLFHEGTLYSAGAFQTAGRNESPGIAAWDASPPLIDVLMYQDPVEDSRLEIWVAADEPLSEDRVRLRVGDEELSVRPVDSGMLLWQSSYELTFCSDSIPVEASAQDPHGNTKICETAFSVGRLPRQGTCKIRSADSRVSVTVEAPRYCDGCYLVISRISGLEDPEYKGELVVNAGTGTAWVLCETVETPDSPTYMISPQGCLSGGQAVLEFKYSAGDVPGPGSAGQLYIESVDGDDLECYVNPGSSTVSAWTDQLGVFRLVSGDPGSSHLVKAGGLIVGAPEPNPFSDSIRLRLVAGRLGRARVSVLDVSGRLVSVVMDGNLPGHLSEVRWDGRNRTGTKVTPGVYFVLVESATDSEIRKVVFVR